MLHSSTLLDELRVALALLTRLPLPVETESFAQHQPRAFWAFPIAGFIVAGLGAIMGSLALWFGLPPFGVAAVALTTQIVVTGALHEDGLADSADGLWGGWTVARRLEIMKDSHIGSYGVLALVLSVQTRAAGLAALASFGATALVFGMLAAGAVSRAACVAVMYALPNARKTGLSASTGRPGDGPFAAALGLGALACLIYGGLFPLILSGLVVLAVIQIAKRKIGGQTGDILGASQQLTEVTVLLCLASAA